MKAKTKDSNAASELNVLPFKTRALPYMIVAPALIITIGSHLSPYAYPFVIDNMMKGNLKTDGVVSSIFKIEEWEKAFEYASGKYGDFKVAFKFD